MRRRTIAGATRVVELGKLKSQSKAIFPQNMFDIRKINTTLILLSANYRKKAAKKTSLQNFC